MKYYSLIDKVYNRTNLVEAYQAVRANKGAPGIDRQTVNAFGENLDKELEALHLELKTGKYVPKPVRRVEIPKPDGSTRPFRRAHRQGSGSPTSITKRNTTNL